MFGVHNVSAVGVRETGALRARANCPSLDGKALKNALAFELGVAEISDYLGSCFSPASWSNLDRADLPSPRQPGVQARANMCSCPSGLHHALVAKDAERSLEVASRRLNVPMRHALSLTLLLADACSIRATRRRPADDPSQEVGRCPSSRPSLLLRPLCPASASGCLATAPSGGTNPHCRVRQLA
jgi:hypothetical protein